MCQASSASDAVGRRTEYNGEISGTVSVTFSGEQPERAIVPDEPTEKPALMAKAGNKQNEQSEEDDIERDVERFVAYVDRMQARTRKVTLSRNDHTKDNVLEASLRSYFSSSFSTVASFKFGSNFISLSSQDTENEKIFARSFSRVCSPFCSSASEEVDSLCKQSTLRNKRNYSAEVSQIRSSCVSDLTFESSPDIYTPAGGHAYPRRYSTTGEHEKNDRTSSRFRIEKEGTLTAVCSTSIRFDYDMLLLESGEVKRSNSVISDEHSEPPLPHNKEQKMHGSKKSFRIPFKLVKKARSRFLRHGKAA